MASLNTIALVIGWLVLGTAIFTIAWGFIGFIVFTAINQTMKMIIGRG